MLVDNFWGALIRSLREEQGVSQRALAINSKVSRTALRRLESGVSSASVNDVERLLETLGYELDALKRDGFVSTRMVAPSPADRCQCRLLEI